QMMTTAIARLTMGSSHNQPVNRMAAPAATTPADTAVSAAMCRNAPLILMSPLRPEAKSQAVTPLITIPTAATIMTMTHATGAGCDRRWSASQAMAPTATSRNMALNSAANMDELRSP